MMNKRPFATQDRKGKKVPAAARKMTKKNQFRNNTVNMNQRYLSTGNKQVNKTYQRNSMARDELVKRFKSISPSVKKNRDIPDIRISLNSMGRDCRSPTITCQAALKRSTGITKGLPLQPKNGYKLFEDANKTLSPNVELSLAPCLTDQSTKVQRKWANSRVNSFNGSIKTNTACRQNKIRVSAKSKSRKGSKQISLDCESDNSTNPVKQRVVPFTLPEMHRGIEVNQLKALNRKLVNENSELKDEISLWEHKQKIELEMGQQNTMNINKLEVMIQKKTASYWMKRLNRHMAEIKKEYQKEINSLRKDFAIQLENSSDMLSSCSNHLISATEEFQVKIAKYQAEIANLNSKIEDTKERNNSLSQSLKALRKQSVQKDEDVTEITRKISKLKSEKDDFKKQCDQFKQINSDLVRKLFKFEKNGELLIMDPYEMHRRMRFYETRCATLNENISTLSTELTTLKRTLKKLNINDDELQRALKKGYFNIDQCNTENFSSKSSQISSNKDKEVDGERKFSQFLPKRCQTKSKSCGRKCFMPTIKSKYEYISKHSKKYTDDTFNQIRKVDELANLAKLDKEDTDEDQRVATREGYERSLNESKLDF
ncbi:unnamed protein product [Moneuplotes crassus]|uniref:Uncharacterized protein n=1 Tax=Euplotes crassus TaxID=5936 RepID=A0AAD1Y7S5_EUPCR|nr:unnamed protein product [Moneuplotes crassus]